VIEPINFHALNKIYFVPNPPNKIFMMFIGIKVGVPRTSGGSV